MKEIWKDIEKYDGMYQISNLGRVRSFRKKKSIVRKLNLHNKGYFQIDFKTKKSLVHIRKIELVHRLVAKAFIPNPDNKPCINHINGIKTDNRIKNLEWCTNKENVKHAWDSGVAVVDKGEAHFNSKLNEKQVRLIKHLRNCKPKMTQKNISKLFGVNQSHIAAIQTGRMWKHITI